MKAYRIKCSNGKYVTNTINGTWIRYSKVGKIFTNINIAKKNLYLCEDFSEMKKHTKWGGLTYELEEI